MMAATESSLGVTERGLQWVQYVRSSHGFFSAHSRPCCLQSGAQTHRSRIRSPRSRFSTAWPKRTPGASHIAIRESSKPFSSKPVATTPRKTRLPLPLLMLQTRLPRSFPERALNTMGCRRIRSDLQERAKHHGFPPITAPVPDAGRLLEPFLLTLR